MSSSVEEADFNELMDRVKHDRSEESFRKLFHHFYGRVLTYFIQGGVKGQKSADLAQETLLTVWNKAALFDGSKGSCAAWIFTIARNLRYDHFRAGSRDVLQLEADDLYEQIEDSSFQIDAKILSDDLRERMNALPEEQKEAIYAMYFEGYSHGEYAALKKIPLGTVKSRIRLALAQLKKGLEEL